MTAEIKRFHRDLGRPILLMDIKKRISRNSARMIAGAMNREFELFEDEPVWGT